MQCKIPYKLKDQQTPEEEQAGQTAETLYQQQRWGY